MRYPRLCAPHWHCWRQCRGLDIERVGGIGEVDVRIISGKSNEPVKLAGERGRWSGREISIDAAGKGPRRIWGHADVVGDHADAARAGGIVRVGSEVAGVHRGPAADDSAGGGNEIAPVPLFVKPSIMILPLMTEPPDTQFALKLAVAFRLRTRSVMFSSAPLVKAVVVAVTPSVL